VTVKLTGTPSTGAMYDYGTASTGTAAYQYTSRVDGTSSTQVEVGQGSRAAGPMPEYWVQAGTDEYDIEVGWNYRDEAHQQGDANKEREGHTRHPSSRRAAENARSPRSSRRSDKKRPKSSARQKP
jgi:hypothetical protein